MNCDLIMSEGLPKYIYNLLKKIGQLGDKSEYNTYVVGGFVRDLMLDWENLDIDIVIEGDSKYFANLLAKSKNGKANIYEQFGTAVVFLSNKLKVDIATARTETYERPGALPTVKPGTIEDDLKRRDFTINAMAIKLNEKEFGELIDPLGGESDLKKGIIRVLHDKSFQDDPTRIFRAIRYEQRYEFQLDKNTENLLKVAVQEDFLSTITKERLRNEIFLILDEWDPADMIARMAQFKLLKYIHPKISFSKKIMTLLDKMELIDFFRGIPLLVNKEEINMPLLRLMAMVDELNDKETEEVIKNLALSKEYAENLIASKTKLLDAIKAISDESVMPSDIYKALKDLPNQALFFGIHKASDKETVLKILTYIVLVDEKPFVTGKDLKRLGYQEGPLYSEILEDVFYAQIDEKVSTKQEAIEYILQKYEK
ncbi:MAG: CCA tRNA nucleotidyltransferase [Candidatus Poribacteria bacterium]